MSDVAKLASSLTLSVDATQLHAGMGPAADKAADIFNSRLTQKMSGATVTTGLADKIAKSLTNGLDNAAVNVNRQVEHMLTSMATSIERHRIGETFARSLNKVNDLIDLHGLTQYRDLLGQIVSVHASLSAVRPPSVSPSTPMGPFGQGMPSGNLMPVGAFGHGGGSNNPTAIYGAFGVSAPPSRIIAGAFGQGNAGIGQNQPHNIQGAFGQGLHAGVLTPQGIFGIGGGSIGVNQPQAVQGAFGVTSPAGRTIYGAFGVGSGPNVAPNPTGEGLLTRAQAHSDRDIAQERERHQARRAAERLQAVERDALSFSTGGYNLGYDGEESTHVIGGMYRRTIEGGRQRATRRENRDRLSRQDSHAARFAAQNIGFGVDDAIQSYHYGGIGGSVRAASNNATAIAGMLISNPVTAAASVIGISIASAAVPVILSKFGTDKAFSDKTATERFYQRARASSIFDADPERTHQDAKGVSEQTWEANYQARVVGRNDANNRSYLKGMSQRGGASAFIDTMASRQVDTSSRLKQNQEELSLLKADNLGLQLRANTEWSGTAKKELERNLARTEELERDNRIAHAERAADAIVIDRARKSLPQNIARQAEMAKYDWETNARFNRGDLTIEDHDKRLEGRAALEKKNLFLNAASYKDDDHRRVMMKVDNDLLEAKADPDRVRNLQLASSQARQANRNYTEHFNGDNSRSSAVAASRENQAEANYRDEVAGNISPAERKRRDALLNDNYIRQRRRAVEDDITDINPELNPYKNQQRQLERTIEDISLRPKDKQESQYRAALIAAERRRDDMRPQARSFISQSVVGSLQDEELRARMTGNYGPAIKREDHQDKNQDQLIAKLEELRQQLQLEAQQIGH